MPPDDEIEILQLGACVQALGHGWRLGLPRHETDDIVRQGRALAEKRNDLTSLALAAAVEAGLTGIQGEVPKGYRLAVEADAIAQQVDPMLRLIVGPVFVYLSLLSGRLRDAIASTERMLASPPDDPMVGADLLYFSPYIFMLVQQGFLLGYMGRATEALEHFERALDLARKHNDVENTGWIHGAFVQAAWLTGDLSIIGTHPEQSVEIAERLGSSFSQVVAYSNVGMAHLLRGDFEAAIEATGRAVAIARERNIGVEWVPLALEFQAQAYLGAGDDRAQAAAEEAIADARRIQEPIAEAQALRSLGKVLISKGAWHEAKDALMRSLSLIEETEARAVEPFVREELAEIALRTGDAEAHARELREAHRLYEKMGATGHLARLDPLVSSS